MVTDIERQRRLSHARPSRHDDQLAWVKPAGDVIQIDQSRRQTGDGMTARIGSDGDQVHRLFDHVLELERLTPEFDPRRY